VTGGGCRMRLFVAVNLPEEVRGRLAAAQERLRAARAQVSWVRPDNMHLTLKFLGETAPDRLDSIRAALAEVARRSLPFEAALGGVGSFGGRVPRVVWAGVTDGATRLAELAGRVDGALAGIGFPRESRPFAPHLTLGRVRAPERAVVLAAALRAEGQGAFGRFRPEAFCLMESRLDPQGSIYTVVDRFTLGAG